ncbi:hypothetical protein F5B20DRAFT_575106 [Whalleya microplaca]|nr:hypothetical protein F5B20DRAFT_575106 [Whalleya microplaca]
MQFLHLLAITALYLLPHATFAQSGCAEDCESCGWFCNNGCDESLDRTACNSCLYCRRESSSCDFVDCRLLVPWRLVLHGQRGQPDSLAAYADAYAFGVDDVDG